MRLLILLLFCVQAFSQKPVLSVVIDSISSQKHTDIEVKYRISYRITNNSANNVSFFFDPNGFGQSLSSKKIFNLFENEKRFYGIEFLKANSREDLEKRSNRLSLMVKDSANTMVKSLIGIDIDSIKKAGKMHKLMDILSKKKHAKKVKDIFQLTANETKTFTQDLYWQKNRYYQSGDLEFYLNENSTFELQFMLILHKKSLKTELSDEVYANIMTNKNFIDGVFYSNKVQIVFKE